MKLGSLFDGVGGFPLAAQRHEIEPVWASEVENFCIKVTEKHFPNMKHLGDITKIKGNEIEPVDIITAGSPCQDLSVAGKRAGLEGARSGLFMEFIRIVREMREATNNEYPRFIIWENVPGTFSSNSGNDFRAVLEEITETKIPMPKSGRWADAGMVRGHGREIAWRCLDAQYWGVPQRRKRIFLVCDFRGAGAGEILFEQDCLRRNIEKGSKKRKGSAGDIGNGVEGTGETLVYSFDSLASNSMKSKNPYSGCRLVDISKTLDSTTPESSKNQGGIAIVQPRQTEYLTGWDNQEKRIFSANGVAPTLSGSDGGGGRTGVGYVAVPAPSVAFQPGNLIHKAGAESSTDVFPTLGATTLGVQFPHVATYWDGGNISDTLDCSMLAKQQMMPEKRRFPAVVQAYTSSSFAQYAEGVGTLKASGGDLGGGSETLVCSYAVRRLTPTECERLQGFPDGWTSGGADTARYKALGNSLAAPCVEWIMSRIATQQNRAFIR